MSKNNLGAWYADPAVKDGMANLRRKNSKLGRLPPSSDSIPVSATKGFFIQVVRRGATFFSHRVFGRTDQPSKR
jgi:hypothetical protein